MSRRTLGFALVAALFVSLASSGIAGEAGPRALLSQGIIGKGEEWATPWYSRDSGIPGPLVLVTGGVHGNEPSGAFAADQIRRWPLTKGKLVVVPRANVKALDARTRRTPDLPVDLGDLNRAFPKSGEPNKATTALASGLWKFVQELKPDWVLDLHEGMAVHRKNSKSVGSTILTLATSDNRPLFEHALEAVNASVDDPTNRFMLLSKSKLADGSLARAARERLGATTAILETTYNDFPLAVRVRQQRLMVNRILRNLAMTEAGPDDLVFGNRDEGVVEIAVYYDGGVGNSAWTLYPLLNSRPEQYRASVVGASEVRAGVLDDFDIVVFPGGSGSKQAASLGEKGRDEVRDFVRRGGGYMGICAGCYLACENFSWSLKILDAKTISSKWKRGKKELDLKFEPGVLPLLGLKRSEQRVLYANGPVMARAGSPGIPDFATWATFVTESAENGTPKGIQVGSPAILAGEFGKGRVLGVSPHPELTTDLKSIVLRLVDWANGASQ